MFTWVQYAESYRIVSLRIAVESFLTPVQYENHTKIYHSNVNKRPTWYKPVTIRQLLRTCFPKIYCFNFTHLKPSNYFSFINAWFNLILGSENLWRHMIRDYLWPKKIFGEEISYKTYFFLPVNNERAKR